MNEPSIPRGTRDFGPAQMARRQYLFGIIRGIFEKYGFQPLETPALENLSVLQGKYGEEGDQLMYRVLNSGNYLQGFDANEVHWGYKHFTQKVAEKGLRYDLTVPFARYVAMNRSQVSFPFKRYQMQPVWRADRPQRGRFREFYQCDTDVVGSSSLLCEAELMALTLEVFNAIGLPEVIIKVNNRKILSGIAEAIGAAGHEQGLFMAIDKLDKIGKEAVEEELRQRGFSEPSIRKLQPIFRPKTSSRAAFEDLKDWFATSEIGRRGVAELEKLWRYVQQYGLDARKIVLDISLARGLSYYTGAIFEVKSQQVPMGSIAGGGRYDNLTAAFGLPDVSGVGISFGIERIYEVMDELGLFPESLGQTTRVLLANFDEKAEAYCLPLLQQLRAAGLPAELYPESVKLKKQLDYADRKGIPFVVLIGSDEMQSGLLTLKNMATGEQQKLDVQALIEALR